MILKKILSLSLLIGMSWSLAAQCFMDRHNTSAEAAWVSCDMSESPNTVRGASHWLHYDLGEEKELGQIHLWNLNHPGGLDSGAKQIVIDYSDDGQTWTEWGAFELDQAEGSGFYEGMAGPDLDGLQTSHLLLTIIENHGGACSGFGEIRIETSEIVSLEEVRLADFKLFPNPASDYVKLLISTDSYENGQMILLDEVGKQILVENITLPGGEMELTMNFPTDIPSGQYLIRIVTDKRDSAQDFSILKK